MVLDYDNYFYAEYYLDGTVLVAYYGMSRMELARSIKNYQVDIAFRGSNHLSVFGRTKDISKLGDFGEKIKQVAKPYFKDTSILISNTKEYYATHDDVDLEWSI